MPTRSRSTSSTSALDSPRRREAMMATKRSRDTMKTTRQDRVVNLPPNAQYIPAASHLVLPAPFSRRPFHDSILSTSLPEGESITHTTDATPKPFVITRPSFCQVLGSTPSVRCLARSDEGRSFAHEAGVWVGASNEVWFTSNLMKKGIRPDGRPDMAVEISAVNVDTGSVRVIDLPQIAAGNGACPFGDRIIFCDQGAGADRPSQLVLVDPRDLSPQPQSDVLINNFHGRPFNSLNDVIVLPSPRSRDRSCRVPNPDDQRVDPGSTIWFTDPPYGHEQAFRHECQLPPQVYVLNPATGDVRVVADGFKHPNGIAFSPDGATCYITDTSHIHGTGHLNPALESTIYAFDVVWPDMDDEDAGPSLQNKRVFAFADTGVPDGIKCDHLGNVYSGCGDGLHVWNKHGTLIGKIVLGLADDNTGAGCANFCFVPGGRIVCFAEDRIYLVEGLQVEGDLVAPARML